MRGFVENFRKDGEYGTKDATLKETFYCVSVLGVKDRRLIRFVKRFRYREGGYVKSPSSYPPYLEETYYTLSILDIAGQIEPDQETRRYLLPLQNSDGGFRRSPYLGISSLENTFYAVMSLKLLDKSI
ncbi:MAG: hypothetical protein H0Z19_05320 [Archaeoglobus sp.]|uniref:prenyltransferase/squalene oxidase repeat-containing protein n=1 Tax=Archaeoglobus sp. TaxID=1872626 RepID=UPI001D702835|nr:hypothetical protein [Archaeoglobus sp.]MBO8179888.1 hypothetical protein [Archaeoglobus sp.]